MSLAVVQNARSPRDCGGRRPYVDDRGAFFGDGTPLLEHDKAGDWRPRRRQELAWLLNRGYGLSLDMEWRMARLGSVAAALNRGDVALAAVALTLAELPPVPNMERARRMAEADAALRRRRSPAARGRATFGAAMVGETVSEWGRPLPAHLPACAPRHEATAA